MVFNPQSVIRNPDHLIWLLSLFLLPGLFAQATTPYTIYGRVARPDDSPASQAIVTISGQTGFERQVFADDMGRFEIRELPAGRYRLTAVNPPASNQYADPVDVDLNRTDSRLVSVNLFLRARITVDSKKENKPGVVTLAEEMQTAPKPAMKAFDEAMKLRGAERYDQSLKKFNRSIELFPSYFQALAERGHLLLTMGKQSEATQDFNHALELNAHYGPALRGSALVKFQQRKYAEAIQDFEQAIDAEPGNATNYYFMGIAGVALDHRDQARAALQKALSIDPAGSVRAHVHVASLLIKENRPAEAAQELEIYLEAVPNPFDADRLRTLLAQLRAAARR